MPCFGVACSLSVWVDVLDNSIFKGAVFGMLRKLGLSVLVMGLCAGGSAAADISGDVIVAYNEALVSKDAAREVKAAQALAAAAVSAPDDPQAGLLAFEAASRLCIRSKCAGAVDAAKLAAGASGEGLPAQSTRDLLVAFADWSTDDTKKTRQQLQTALEAAKTDAPVLLSVAAFETYYVDVAQTGKQSNLQVAAQMAADHFRPARDVIPKQWATAEIVAASAAFNSKRRPEALTQMASAEFWLDDLKAATDDEPKWMRDLYYRAWAWRSAMYAYFKSKGKGKSILAAIEAQRAERYDKGFGGGDKVGEDKTPFCEGRITRLPRPEFPRSAAFNGYVGAVLIGFDLEDGELVNVRVLASVPSDTFDQSTLESMEDVEWTFDADQPNPDCARSRENMVFPFEYNLG